MTAYCEGCDHCVDVIVYDDGSHVCGDCGEPVETEE